MSSVDVVEFALNPLNIFAFTRMARKMLGSKVDNISQAQLEQAARILVSEDADLIQRALTDQDALSILAKRVGQLLNITTTGATTASAFTAEKAASDLSIISPAFAGEADYEVVIPTGMTYPQFVESGGMVVDSGSPISVGAYSQYLQSIGAEDTTIGAIQTLPPELNAIIENLPENAKKKIIESAR